MSINITVISDTNSTSLPYAFSYSIALPYFFIGLIILVVGITGFKTKRADRTALAGLLASILFAMVIPNTISITMASIFGLITFFAVLENLFKKRRQQNVNERYNQEMEYEHQAEESAKHQLETEGSRKDVYQPKDQG